LRQTLETPTEILLKVAKYKHQAALPGFIIIAISFFGIDIFSELYFLKYLSLIGLFWFIFIMAIYRINKIIVINNDGNPVAPIDGKVVAITEINDNIVVKIKRSLFERIDIRQSLSEDFVVTNNQNICVENGTKNITYCINGWKTILIRNTPKIKSNIMGVIIGNGNCVYTFPKSFKKAINIGDKTSAGETIIAYV